MIRRVTLYFALAAVCAVLAGGLFTHEHDSGKACQICHVAHLPTLTATALVPAIALAFLAWHAPAQDASLHPDPFSGNSRSRAPPA